MYHEYVDPKTGEVRRRHYNGIRLPIHTDERNLADEIWAQADPDSRLWADAARQALNQLARLIGDELSLQFVDELYPDGSIRRHTWRSVCHQVDSAFAVAFIRRETSLEKLLEAARANSE